MHTMKLLAAFIGLGLVSACTLPGVQVNQGLSVQDQAATIVAQTMQAAVPSAMAAITPFASPAAPSAPAATPTGKPTLFINSNNTSCRSGPGGDFKVVATFASGTIADLVGRDSVDNYWIVTDPISHDLCWVSVQDSTPSGTWDTLPELTPSAPDVTAPSKPSRGSWNYSCDNTSLTTILGWSAPAGPVNGYRIFRAGSQVADVPATQTSYTETVPFTYGNSINYGVAAYNDAGMSPQATWNFHCP